MRKFILSLVLQKNKYEVCRDEGIW
jgi:hypothetical protein